MKILIEVEKTTKGYMLWTNTTEMRRYSKRGENKALEDARMIKAALESLGWRGEIWLAGALVAD